MSIAPIVKRVTVATTQQRAFESFTTELADWWPLATHSIGETRATGVKLEGAVGGRIVEYGDSGPLGYWSTVSDWDPPNSLSFTWHPGTDPKQAGHLTVTFAPHSNDNGSSTDVELTHTGWDRRPDGVEARDRYSSGWDHVLDFYIRHNR